MKLWMSVQMVRSWEDATAGVRRIVSHRYARDQEGLQGVGLIPSVSSSSGMNRSGWAHQTLYERAKHPVWGHCVALLSCTPFE